MIERGQTREIPPEMESLDAEGILSVFIYTRRSNHRDGRMVFTDTLS